MRSRISVLFSTVKYLTVEQIFYQFLYRIKKFFVKLNAYTEYLDQTIYDLKNVKAIYTLVPSLGKYSGRNNFFFLNVSHTFDSEIDWNFLGNGKLWNYNLQYFDYLHDKAIEDTEKQRLIEDFCKQLLNGTVAPEPYPVSLRIINWLYYSSNTGYTSDNFRKCIQLQTAYLRYNLEFHIQANHLLENYISLYFAAIAFRCIPLKMTAEKGLQKQLSKQILNDGAHCECSPMYHSVLLSKLLLLIGEADSAGEQTTNSVYYRKIAVKMLGWLNSYCFNNGEWAPMNDASTGVAPGVKDLFNEASRLNLPILRSELTSSGYRKLLAGDWEVLVDVGDIMPSYQPGHAHSDLLSICMQYAGTPILTDTGTSTYTIGQRRQLERSTFSHNTVIINNDNQSEVWGGFRVGKRARVIRTEFSDYHVCASHDGYAKKWGIIHTRTVTITPEMITVEDCLKSKSAKDSNIKIAMFHFDHNCIVELDQLNCLVVNKTLCFDFQGAFKVEKGNYQQAIGFNLTKNASFVAIYFDVMLKTMIKPR